MYSIFKKSWKIASLLFVSTTLLAENTYIKTGAILDVSSGKLLENKVIVVKNDMIENIYDSKSFTLPSNGTTIDLSNKILLPGLMDMHVHLTSNANAHGYKRLSASLPRQTLNGVKNAESTLMAGFTTVRNVGAPGFADVALRDAINDGDIIGPRMFVAGRSLGITGGHCDNNLLPYHYQTKAGGVADGPWAVRAKVRENIKYGATVIKFCATGGVLSKGTKVGAQQYSQEEMNAIVAEAKLRGITVAAHAHGLEGIKSAIKAGVTSVEHASFLDKEAIKLAKKYGTYFSMDIFTTEYILEEGEKAGILQESLDKERVVGKTQRDNFTKAVKAGVKMVFGTDAGVYPHGNNGKQFSRMVRFGMTPLQAIQAATLHPAKMLKQEKLGQIKTGYVADMIAVDINPLDDISVLENILVVIKGGKVVKHIQ